MKKEEKEGERIKRATAKQRRGEERRRKRGRGKRRGLVPGNALAVIATIYTQLCEYLSLMIFVVCTPSKIGLFVYH